MDLEENLIQNMHKLSEYPVFMNILQGAAHTGGMCFIELHTGGIKDISSAVAKNKAEALSLITTKVAIKHYLRK